ncbi:MAG TPA: hypothetical protein VHQ65_11340 [Thermoanaerobaculia bacterium]|nr:hypothetical protein [Thermoanaerobaculia bacterium]
MTRPTTPLAHALETRTLEMLQSARQLAGDRPRERELRLLLDAAEATWRAARQLHREPDVGQRDTSTDTVGGPTESPPPGPGFAFWETLPPGPRRHFADLADARAELLALLIAEWRAGEPPQDPLVIDRGFTARRHLERALERLLGTLERGEGSPPSSPPPPDGPPTTLG